MAQRALWGRSPDVRARYRPVTSAHRLQRPSQSTSADVTLAKSNEAAGGGRRRSDAPLSGKYSENRAAAAGHRGVEGAAGVHPLLGGGDFGVLRENRLFEPVDHQAAPPGNREPQSFFEGDFRHLRDDSRIGLAGGNVHRRDLDLDAVILKRNRRGRKDLPPSAAEHRAVVDEKGAVAAEFRSPGSEILQRESEGEHLADHREGESSVCGPSSESCADWGMFPEEYLYRGEFEFFSEFF